MRTTDEIFNLYLQRIQRLDPMRKSAMEVRAAYYGDITLPIPEIDRNEKPLVANFLYSAGEQKAQRVASTMPTVYFPSKKPGVDLQDKFARWRREVLMSWWDRDRMKLKMRKRARHLVYYAASPVMLRPDFKDKRPTWQVRNPLTALAPEMDTGELVPEDIIFVYNKSYAWLVKKYPQAVREFGNPQDLQDGVFSILEYQDADDSVLCAVGEKVVRSSTVSYGPPVRVQTIVELERTPNRLGRCCAVLPGGIGLDHARGGFDGMIGMWQMLGKLMALEVIGIQRAIWKETWLVDDPTGDGAKIITPADPLHGVVGRVTGGKIQFEGTEPSVFATQLMSYIERYLRLDAGIPSELGGESGTNIRTAKRGDQILSSVLDFPLQEMQEILTVALQEENKLAIAIDKTYFPISKSVYFSPAVGEFDYEPNGLFVNDTHYVRYSHEGVDAQGLVVELGQLVGTGLMSKRTAMESHPAIEDAETEFDRIYIERLRDALANGLATLAQDPTQAPVIAQITKQLAQSEIEVEDAVIAVHNALQEQQAQQAAQAQQAQMGQPGPEAQPGMAQPVPSIGAPPQSLTNLTSLLQQLRKGPMANVPNQLGIAS